MLQEFKNFNADRMDLAQLVELAAFGRALNAEYEALQLEAPEWVTDNIKTLRREIKSRNADQVEARRKDIRTRLDALKTPAEKRAELQKQLKELDEVHA